MAESDHALRELSLGALAARCERETGEFYQGRDHDPQFCFELFRRAAEDADQRAWELIYRQYHAQIHAWIVRRGAFGNVVEEPAYYVNLALERLWTGLSGERFGRFSSLASILSYLKRCVATALIDDARKRQVQQVGLDSARKHAIEDESNPERIVQSTSEGEALWEYVRSCTKDEAEHTVVYESFVLALKPAEIHARHRKLFNSVKEVYRVKQNIMSRFRRDEQFREWLPHVD